MLLILTVCMMGFLSNQTNANIHKLIVKRVIDGDTIVASIIMDLDICLVEQIIRMSDYDAWESSKRRRSVDVTDEEVQKGKIATKMLKILLSNHEYVYIKIDRSNQRDHYGRVLGSIVIVTGDNKVIYLKDWMIEGGHIRVEPN